MVENSGRLMATFCANGEGMPVCAGCGSAAPAPAAGHGGCGLAWGLARGL